jgi:NodT family efflux transporter outer membrane factor (OMF) lipoprotein
MFAGKIREPRRVSKKAAFAAVLYAVFLASCTVGPKYSKPSVPTTPSFKEAPPVASNASGMWHPTPGETELPGKWWEIYGDAELNALEEQIDPSNLDLQVAEARFREARAAVHYSRAAQYPALSTAPSIDSLRNSAHRPNFNQSNPQATGDFLLPFDLSYEVDFWGRVRRTISAAREEAQASAADLATLSLSLHAELAIDYFELHTLDAQQQILNDTVRAYTEALRLTNNRYQGGVAARQEVAQAQTQLNTTQAEATDVGVQRAQYEHAIAILLGKPPALFNLPARALQATPPDIPLGVPSTLLERRPDIASAERRVAEANDQIGLARAAYFPTVTLSATAGLEGTSLLNWFTWPARFWAVGPQAAELIYDGGRRRANMLGAEANYDATVATYRKTTLTAFQQVEDNLAALRILQKEATQQRDAVESSQNLLTLSMNRYRGGVDTYLQVITSQTINLTNQRTEIDIMRRRMDASVLLVKALGGGWTTASLPAVSSLK